MTDVNFDMLLKIGEFVGFIGGGALVIFKLGRTTERFELVADNQQKELAEIKDDVKGLNKVVTTLAVQGNRLDGMEQRLSIMDKRYEDLRHGEGFTLPLSR